MRECYIHSNDRPGPGYIWTDLLFRRRVTHSQLFETGYSISYRTYLGRLFTYVLQSRKIEQFGSVNWAADMTF